MVTNCSGERDFSRFKKIKNKSKGHNIPGVVAHTKNSVHGRNLVGDTGDVSRLFFGRGGHNMPCSPTFCFRFCIWKGLKNESDVCHVLCE